MKKSTLVLLVVGVLLEAVALLTSYPDRFPIVLRIVSPEYQNAKKALALLDNMKPVTRESDGFAELEKLFLAPLRKENLPEVFENVKLVRITRTKTIGSQAFTSHGMDYRIPLEVHFSNGQKLDWDLSKARIQVEEMKSADFFGVAIILFGCGVLSQSVGVFIEFRGSRNEKAAQRH